MSKVHIIGGGVAGLAAAVELSRQAEVHLYEGAMHCGGRVRSFFDARLDRRIDNGNHMFLSANDSIFHYLKTIGAEDQVAGPKRAVFPFFDIKSLKPWVLKIPAGVKDIRNIFSRKLMPPGMRLLELHSFYKILNSKPETTVHECLVEGSLKHYLLNSLAISALNTPIKTASARLLGNIFKITLMRGGKACVPCYAKDGLSETFVDPAVKYIEYFGGKVELGKRVSQLNIKDGFVVGIETSKGMIEVSHDDHVVLAASPRGTAEILKKSGFPLMEDDLGVTKFQGILNVHFRVDPSFEVPHLIKETGFVGLAGSVAEWVFIRDDVLSVTVSAADTYESWDRADLIKTIWSDVCLSMGFSSDKVPEIPVHRVIWEKRATFEATYAQQQRRLGTLTPWPNLVLAGDTINNNLPSTIQGAIETGLAAVGALGYRSYIEEPFQSAD